MNHYFVRRVDGVRCDLCGCPESDRFTLCEADPPKDLSARLDAAERELESLRERHDKALSLLSDVVLQNTRMNERLMRVEGWMKAELAKLG